MFYGQRVFDAKQEKALKALVSGAWNLRDSESVVPIALYGDSRAAGGYNGTANQYDMRSWVSSAPTGAVAGGNLGFRSGGAVQSYYPAAKIVACCGKSGDSLQQMIDRETAGASATRKSLDDAWSTGARVLIFRASINTITTAVTAVSGYVQATTDSIIAQRQDLIQRAVNRGFLVIDEGEAGYDYVGDAVNFPQTRIDAIRQTIAAVNVAAAAFAAASGGTVYYINVAALTCDASGQWLPGMCQDTGSPAQRVHTSTRAADLIGRAEAALLTQLYRGCGPSYVRYGNGLSGAGNLLPNADLIAATSGLGTGWGVNGSGSAPVRTPSIITRGGKRWQTVMCTFGAAQAGSYGAIYLPIPIHSGGTITVAAGEVYGYEVDVFIDDGFGGPPPISDGAAFSSRLRIYTSGADSVYYDGLLTDVGSPGFTSAWEGSVIFNPIAMFAASAAIVGATPSVSSSTQWAVTYGNASGLPFRIGASSPRMVRLA